MVKEESDLVNPTNVFVDPRTLASRHIAKEVPQSKTAQGLLSMI